MSEADKSLSEPLGIAFTTPGLIPIEAFTMFGVNAKPNSQNPIGYFGTGLKYAIAVLMRHKIGLIIWIGRTRYEFLPESKDFRGKEFNFIEMRKSKGLFSRFTATNLPFTTELGKNWELWQAFRELEANTRDENGLTHPVFDQISHLEHPISDQTQILVGGTDFVDVWRKRNDIFLNKAKDNEELPLRFIDEATGVEVYNRPSQHVYYRGMRIYDLAKEKVSKYTYNIISSLDLTEDRTAKYSFYIYQRLAQVVMRSNDREFIRAIVESKKDTFEADFAFDSAYIAPNQTYMDVMFENRTHAHYLPRAYTAYLTYKPPPPPDPNKKRSLQEEIKQWQEDFIQDRHDNSELCERANGLFNRVLKKEPIEAPVLDDTNDSEPEPGYGEVVGEHQVVMNAATGKDVEDVDEEVPF